MSLLLLFKDADRAAQSFPYLEAWIALTTNPGAAPFWTEVTPWVLQATVERGRQHELDRIEASRCTLVLDNSDRRFEPQYAGLLVNLVTVPSFENEQSVWTANGWSTATNFWIITGGGFRRAIGISKFGGSAAELDGTFQNEGAAYSLGSLPAGTHTASVYLRGGPDTQEVQLILGEDGAAAATSSLTPAAGVWTRASLSWTATGNPAFLMIRNRAPNGSFYRFWMDGVQVEAGAAASEYVDGDQENARWAGAVQASQSYRGGPYYPNVLPMRRVRLRAVYRGSYYDRFSGFVTRWPPNWQGPDYAETRLECVDAFDVIANDLVSATFGQQLSGARINAVLDGIGWPAGERTIDAGQTTVAAATLTQVNPLQHIQDVADSELGLFFIDGAGKAVFHDRHRRLKAPYTQSQATFGDGTGELPYDAVGPSFDRDQITNRWEVTRAGGTLQAVEDTASIAKYRRRAKTRAPLLTSDAEALDQARFLLAQTKEAALRFDSLELQPLEDSTFWTSVLGREIGDRVTVKRRPPPGGTQTQQSHIEGLGDQVTPPREWATPLRLSPAELQQAWVLGDAENGLLGQTTILAY